MNGKEVRASTQSRGDRTTDQRPTDPLPNSSRSPSRARDSAGRGSASEATLETDESHLRRCATFGVYGLIHSDRKLRTGSDLIARMAGTMQAPNPVTASVPITTASNAGSFG
jgi:hypothetical protein